MNKQQLEQQKTKELHITQALVCKLFDYHPDIGWLTWKQNTTAEGLGTGKGGCRRKDKRAGTRYSSLRGHKRYRYRRIQIGKHQYLEHRIVWLHVHGKLPEWPMVIDHANGDGCDNRIANLRAATRSQNVINTERRVGLKNIWLQNGKWSVRLNIGGFETREEAALFAYNTMKQFHGDFVNSKHYGLVNLHEPCYQKQ